MKEIQESSEYSLMKRFSRQWVLFRNTFLISLTANSGYAILSVMQTTFVRKLKWLSEEEMADCVALAQSTPGPMAISSSMVIGYQTAGLGGALAAVLGCALPPLLVMIPVTFFYNTIISNPYVALFMEGMQYGVAAMLIDVLTGLFLSAVKKEKAYPILLMAAAFLYIRLLKGPIFLLVIFCIAAGLLKTFLFSKKRKEGSSC